MTGKKKKVTTLMPHRYQNHKYEELLFKNKYSELTVSDPCQSLVECRCIHLIGKRNKTLFCQQPS